MRDFIETMHSVSWGCLSIVIMAWTSWSNTGGIHDAKKVHFGLSSYDELVEDLIS